MADPSHQTTDRPTRPRYVAAPGDTVEDRLEAALSEIAWRDEVIAIAEADARRYAGYYPPHSSSRNTFVILADRIAELAK